MEKRIFPIRFERLDAGSLFRIFAEPSRRIRRSHDNTVYRKAYDGFYSTPEGQPEVGVVLMPNDLVLPLSRGGK